jgi:ABC-2 type transport system ATP-binding protein
MHPAPVVLRVDGLRKRFGGLVAVDGLSLEVREGEIFGLLGPNGAGKTTTISMMSGLLRPDAGQTYLRGEAIAAGEPGTRARIGVCPQQVVLWPRLTCVEQLVFMGECYDVPTRTARVRADELLRAVGLWDKRDALSRALSGGMQRRLSIVMALVHDPEIVVLDEPEAGLDPQSRVLVREYIAVLAREKKKTVLFTTHNMDEAQRVVDRVAIIDHGKLLELDTPDALRRRVGGGDTLELGLAEGGAALSGEAEAQLRAAFPAAEISGGSLIMRKLAVIDELPAVLEALRRRGVTVTRVQLRESTLEDVFLTLTGRRLRDA